MPFSRGSHYNRRLVGVELQEFDRAFRLTKHTRECNTRQVGRVLAEGASIGGSHLIEERPLMMIASGTTKSIVWISPTAVSRGSNP